MTRLEGAARDGRAATREPSDGGGRRRKRGGGEGRRTRSRGARSVRLDAGATVDVVFEPNPREGSPFRWRATRVAGRGRTSKAILANDERIRPGVPVRVRIDRVVRPNAAGRGWYAARYAGPAGLRLPDDVWVDPYVHARIEGLLAAGTNVLLLGPQGCGKNTVAEAIARAMGYAYTYFNASAVMETTDFVAQIRFAAGPDGTPVPTWVPTEILRAIVDAEREPARRRLVFIDEISRVGRDGARNGLMSALDATRRIFDPVTTEFRAIPDAVQFVCAANQGARFTSTTPIDAAQLDRFAAVHLDYPPAAVERRLVGRAAPEAGASLVDQVVRLARTIRDDAEIAGGVSVRATIDAARTLAVPGVRALGDAGRQAALVDAFCGRLDGELDDPTTDKGRAQTLVRAALGGGRGATSDAASRDDDEGLPW